MATVSAILASGKDFQSCSKRDLQIIIAELLREIVAAGGGGGGGGSGQIVAYTTTDPNTDGVLPTDQTKPAIAVKPGATTYTWSTVNLDWE